MPQEILTPERVETRIGTLEFLDGLPSEETVKSVHDSLDCARGMQVFPDGMPSASLHAMCLGLAGVGVEGSAVGIFEDLYNARALLLTPNTTTVHVLLCTDLAAGPLVIEVPQGLPGAMDDAYFRHVVDVGVTGPDKGAGGKYLFVLPDYDGPLPDEGYFVVRTPGHVNWLFVRAFVGDAGLEATVAGVREIMRVYPRDRRGQPPGTDFVNLTDKQFDTIYANDVTLLRRDEGGRR